MAKIELRGVSKHFAANVVVKAASFTIRDGEFFILVGPSGCGKSTLLNMIVGLEAASSGDIFLDGVRINDVDPKDRNMAMVFQSYALYPHMTVRENMAFPLRLAGMTKTEIEGRVAQTAEILELAALLDRKPAALSGGQRQRVAMGRAIVREPAVFLLDEPLSNLDAKLRAQMRTEIARLQRRLGTTTVYVTHDQTEAMTLGDRIAVLRKGEVLQIGTPRDLYERPATLFVAGFIGSPAMNFLPARPRDGALELPVGTLELSGELRDRVAAADGTLVAGFRPDHVQTGAGEVPGGLGFEARAEVVEWLGTDTYIYADVALADFAAPFLPEDLDIRRGDARHRTLVARVDPRDDARVKEGELLRLCLDPRHVHLFDTATGHNLFA
jgi:multiple sugar transport system ATP-binding protein